MLRAPSSTSTASGSSLYERAVQQREEREKRREKDLLRDCTFSPTLVSNRKLREKRSTTPGGKRYDMLYQEASARKQRQSATPSELEECTFSPQTNATKGKSKAATPRGVSPARRAESLYNNAKRMEEKRRQMAEERRRLEVEQCSFKPQITAKARAARPASPSVRMEELHKSHKALTQRLEAAKAEREVEGCTFKPTINRRRRASTGGAPAAGSVQDRLTRYQKDLERKREEALQRKLDEEAKELTFQPNITRAKPTADAAPAPASGTIHERLYSEASARQDDASPGTPPSARPKARPASPAVFDRLSAPKSAARSPRSPAEEYDVLKECTFTPKTRRGSIGGRPSSRPRSNEPLWDRLHKDGADSKEKRERLKLEKERSECSFKPKTSSPPAERAPGRQGASSKPIWERLNEEAKRNKEREDELAKARAEKELAECTFKPNFATADRQAKAAGAAPAAGSNGNAAPAGAAKAASSRPIWERLADPKQLADKQKEMERLREQAELEECTFQPALQVGRGADLEQQSTSPAGTTAATPTKPVKASPAPKAKRTPSSTTPKPLSYLERIKSAAKPSPTPVRKARASQASEAASPMSPAPSQEEKSVAAGSPASTPAPTTNEGEASGTPSGETNSPAPTEAASPAPLTDSAPQDQPAQASPQQQPMAPPQSPAVEVQQTKNQASNEAPTSVETSDLRSNGAAESNGSPAADPARTTKKERSVAAPTSRPDLLVQEQSNGTAESKDQGNGDVALQAQDDTKPVVNAAPVGGSVKSNALREVGNLNVAPQGPAGEQNAKSEASSRTASPQGEAKSVDDDPFANLLGDPMGSPTPSDLPSKSSPGALPGDRFANLQSRIAEAMALEESLSPTPSDTEGFASGREVGSGPL